MGRNNTATKEQSKVDWKIFVTVATKTPIFVFKVLLSVLFSAVLMGIQLTTHNRENAQYYYPIKQHIILEEYYHIQKLKILVLKNVTELDQQQNHSSVCRFIKVSSLCNRQLTALEIKSQLWVYKASAALVQRKTLEAGLTETYTVTKTGGCLVENGIVHWWIQLWDFWFVVTKI